jgi:hypothetical protein
VIRLSFVLLFSVVLIGCATKVAGPASSPFDQSEDVVGNIIGRHTMMEDFSKPTTDLSKVNVPLLRAPGLEAGQGKPVYSVMDDGSYIARSHWGRGKYLVIVGTLRSGNQPDDDVHGTFNLMGRRQNYYFSGNEDPELTSMITSLRGPDGRRGNYVIVFGALRNELKGDFARAVPDLGW